MSKKRKKGAPAQQNTNTINAGMGALLAAAMTGGAIAIPVKQPRRSFSDTMKGVRNQPNVARAWGVQCSRECCRTRDRDAVIVAQPTAAEVAAHRARGADPRLNLLWVCIFNGHNGGELRSALVDVEDAKRLVNLLGEAIAAVEATADTP